MTSESKGYEESLINISWASCVELSCSIYLLGELLGPISVGG